jgi:hypothetical protein
LALSAKADPGLDRLFFGGISTTHIGDDNFPAIVPGSRYLGC